MKGAAILLLIILPLPCAPEEACSSSAQRAREQSVGGDLCTFIQLPPKTHSRRVPHESASKLETSVRVLPSRTFDVEADVFDPGVSNMKIFTGEPVPGGSRLLKVALSCALLVFVAFAFSDMFSFWRLLQGNAGDQVEQMQTHQGEGSASTPTAGPGPQPAPSTDIAMSTTELARPRSFTSILGFTVIRLYTGFLSATWLPFLLAMEGQDLWKENQSLFMGVAKLIYGMTILMNPMLGLLGDKAVAVSHGLGRRIFIRCGVLLCVTGIFICLKADHDRNFYVFMLGILIWRLGDATVDVTAEVLVPELVPKEQYALAGRIKAAAFLVGALFGYVLLIFFVDVSYTWLYYAYLGGMLSCIAPMMLLLGDGDQELVRRAHEAPVESGEAQDRQRTFQGMMVQAYIAPALVSGWLPLFSFASFLFGCGTSPMFFLLLMIRDVVGVSDSLRLQDHFSACSMLFFVCAAISALLSAACEPAAADKDGVIANAMLANRLRRTACYAFWYALVAIMMIASCIPETLQTREMMFYTAAGLLGCVFGPGYAKFQEITWQLMPEDSDVAKASIMGFNVMCRIFGVGIGNFAAGLILDFFLVDSPKGSAAPMSHQSGSSNALWFKQAAPVYRHLGYWVMVISCAIVCFASGLIVRRIAAGVDAESERPRPAA